MSKNLVVHRTIDAMRLARKAIAGNQRVGFVPTMGALHEGHLSLMRQAATENDVVVASIFVNPTQFGPNEDLDQYPRTWDSDNELLRQSNAVDLLFAPTHMYSDHHFIYVGPEEGSYFDQLPEAVVRPGHFRGVATIVTKLLNIVQPTRAYFGQKDAAQCVLIRKLVDDLSMDTTIVIGDTVREQDGLAMSSRNAYLSEQERPAANVLYRSLRAAYDLYQESIQQQQQQSSVLTAQQLNETVRAVLQSEPLVKEIQYIAIDDYDTMKPLASDSIVTPEQDVIISLACQVGNVRLIDNMVLKPESPA